MTEDHELERCRRKRPWRALRQYPSIYLDTLTISRRKFSEQGLCTFEPKTGSRSGDYVYH